MQMWKPSVPIIFFQVGDFMRIGAKRFLEIAVRQAALASPASNVILLTDLVLPNLPEITQVALTDHREAAAKFERVYRHTSVNDAQYEMFCFSRWFYIRDFVRRHGIERFCVFDCDILLFDPVEHFVAEFDGYQAGNWTWANVICARALDLMCDYFERIFRDRQLLTVLAERYRIGDAPHISDMMALLELAKGDPVFLNQNALPAKGFDDNINQSMDGLFVMDGPIKWLTVGADGIPVGRCAGDGAAVPFHFLHFQSDAKSLMAKFAWHGQIYELARLMLG